MVVCHLYAVILDPKRQSDAVMLRLDKVFQKIVGFDGYSVQSTISRFLKSFRVETDKGIAHVNHQILTEASRNFEGSHFYGANVAHFHLAMLAYTEVFIQREGF